MSCSGQSGGTTSSSKQGSRCESKPRFLGPEVGTTTTRLCYVHIIGWMRRLKKMSHSAFGAGLSGRYYGIIQSPTEESISYSTAPTKPMQVTRAIEDPLVLRQLQFAQEFQMRFCAVKDFDGRVPVSGAGRACQEMHRPFLLASRRCVYA